MNKNFKKPLTKADTKFLAGRTISEVARANGISPDLAHTRRHNGWSVEQATTIPKGERRPLKLKKAPKLPPVTNPLAGDSAVPGSIDPILTREEMDELGKPVASDKALNAIDGIFTAVIIGIVVLVAVYVFGKFMGV